MLGAVIGDIAGSRYEFSPAPEKDLKPLIRNDSRFTDDTVMSLAVAKAVMEGGENILKTKRRLVENMQMLGRAYPDAGFGAHFKRWLMTSDPQPYGSWGNGAPMRVSSIGWMKDSLDDVQRYARLSAEVSHTHPMAVTAAEATAEAVFLARESSSKHSIQKRLEKTFGYTFNQSAVNDAKKQVRDNPQEALKADVTVLLALDAFFSSRSFEEAIEKAILASPDTDTTAAIAGSVAEPYYGIRYSLRNQGLSKLPDDLKEIYQDFLKYL